MDGVALYDLINEGYTADLDFYLRETDGPLPIIELGSGTGRIALHLFDHGRRRLHGVEKDPGFRRRLASELRARGYRGRHEMALEHVGREPAQILLPFNFLFHLPPEEARELLDRLFAAPSCRVLLDVDNLEGPPDPGCLEDLERLGCGQRATEVVRLIDGRVHVEQKLWVGEAPRARREFDLWLHPAELVLESLELSARPHRLLGGFERQPYNRHSPKLIVVAHEEELA